MVRMKGTVVESQNPGLCRTKVTTGSLAYKKQNVMGFSREREPMESTNKNQFVMRNLLT